ncbi:Cell division protein FtsQ [metagenome]|uniref:Cell division protein FtsQ n=1 Tax=metagenome TaxID=256318 RepID=A0A2P2BW88_9ZZZZ
MSTDSMERTIERTRKRFARRQRTQRWLRWRAILAAVLVVVLVAVAVWLVFFSSVFAVKGVVVTGASLLEDDEVRAAAAAPVGEPLAGVDLAQIEGRLRALAPVKDVVVTRVWPDQIKIALVERTAVAAVPVGAGFKGIDADGVLFRDFQSRPKGLPEIVLPDGIGQDAMKEGADVVAALPSDLQKRIDHVEVESIDKISLVLGDDKVVVWGSAEESADKARVLTALIAAAPNASQYDVSAPGQPTTRR